VQHVNDTENHKADHGDEEWNGNVDRTFAEVIRALGEDNDKDGANDVGCDSVEIGLHSGETEATDDLREEVSVQSEGSSCQKGTYPTEARGTPRPRASKAQTM
jgi:hypothetical protein